MDQNALCLYCRQAPHGMKMVQTENGPAHSQCVDAYTNRHTKPTPRPEK